MKMSHADALETYSYYAKEIKSRFPELAYLHAIEGRDGISDNEPEAQETLDFLVSCSVTASLPRWPFSDLLPSLQRDIWSPKPFFAAGGHTPESAAAVTSAHDNVAVVFGRHFISNVSANCPLGSLLRFFRALLLLQTPKLTLPFPLLSPTLSSVSATTSLSLLMIAPPSTSWDPRRPGDTPTTPTLPSSRARSNRRRAVDRASFRVEYRQRREDVAVPMTL
jgi:hypothetical protein